MSDRALQSYNASAEKSRHPLHNYQSLGMSHSSEASFNSAHQEKNQLSSPLGHLSLGEGGCLTTGSSYYSTSNPSFQGYPISYQSQQSGRRFVLNFEKETRDIQLLKSQLARSFENTNNALSISRGDFSSVHRATPLWAQTSHSTSSQIQPQRFILGECTDEGGSCSVPFVICRQETVDHLQSMQAFNNSRDIDLRFLKQGYGNYQSDSTLLLSQENKDIGSTSRRSVIPMLRKDDGSFVMLNDVSPKHNHSQPFCQEQHQRIQNLPHIGLVPSWSDYSKLDMLDQQQCLQARFGSVDAVMSMRTFTPVNSVRMEHEGPYMNSETTRSFPNGERVDNSFCKENRLFEKSAVLDLNKNPCQLSGHSQQGVKLQLGDSLTTSGAIESVHYPSAFRVVSKNELSTGTGTLNMDIEESHLSGAKSVLVNKDVRMHDKLTSTDVSVSPKEVQSKPVIPEIPDLNIALPEFPSADNLMGDLDPSTQRSKIPDRGSLHAREHNIKNRKKRKMGDILNLGDSPRQEIVNKSVGKSGKGGRTKSKLTFAGKELIVLDSDDDSPALVGESSSTKLIKVEKITSSDKNGKTPSAEGVWKTEEITPHSWPLNPPTRHSAQENPEQTVAYKPQSSNVCSEPIRRWEVPSTAAMAAITINFNKQIDINDKDNGLHKGPEASSLEPCYK